MEKFFHEFFNAIERFYGFCLNAFSYYLNNITLCKIFIAVIGVGLFLYCFDVITHTSGKYIARLFRYFYLLFLFSITVLGRKRGITSDFSHLFITYYSALNGVAGAANEIILNIVIFIPLGIVLTYLYSVKKTVIYSIAITIFIETVQLLTTTGVFEICDLINNSIGGWMGAAIFKCLNKIQIRKPNCKKKSLEKPQPINGK